VGCNYPSKAFGLAGAVNDAFLLAECLQQSCGFEPDNVCILHDVLPGQKKSQRVDPTKAPTRLNILQRLQWLVRNSRPGDVLFFSFSGYGVQVDDVQSYQDEGLEEAVLPTDFIHGCDGDYAVILTSDIHDILMGVPRNCSATVLMDCDHATTVVDIAGTLDGKLVSGLRLSSVCGLQVHQNKLDLGQHDREVWQEQSARAAKARPRFQQMMEIENPRKGRLPTREGMSRSAPIAFCYSAARHGQTALEMQVTRLINGKSVARQHGILTWCFVQALQELGCNSTHLQVLEDMKHRMRRIREEQLPRLDQEVLLTFCTPLSKPSQMGVLQGPEVPAADLQSSSPTAGGNSIGHGPVAIAQPAVLLLSPEVAGRMAVDCHTTPPPAFRADRAAEAPADEPLPCALPPSSPAPWLSGPPAAEPQGHPEASLWSFWALFSPTAPRGGDQAAGPRTPRAAGPRRAPPASPVGEQHAPGTAEASATSLFSGPLAPLNLTPVKGLAPAGKLRKVRQAL